MRGAVTLTLQVAVSIALLALLARQVAWADIAAVMGRLRPTTIAAALGLTLVSYLGRAQRWAGLLARAGRPVALGPAWALTLVGVGYGLVTPGKVGEFARVLHLGVPRPVALASVVWDRLTDVILLELLALPAFVFVPAWRGTVLALFALITLATLLILVALEHVPLQTLLARLVSPLRTPLARWREASAGTLTSDAFRLGLAGGAFYYALNFTAAFLLLRDLVPHAPMSLMLGFPIIPLLGNLPIAFSGIGLREHVSATMFAQLGSSAAAGPAYSLSLFAITTLLPGLLGLCLTATPWVRSARAGAAS